MSKLSRLKTFAPGMPSWLDLSGGDGYLTRTGWLRRRSSRTPMDAAGRPIPWITYPCLSFLSARVRPEMRVFEYGCGASTLWWASRVRSVVACEHDRAWLERTREQAPGNVDLVYAADEGEQYAAAILAYPAAFDIVVIDGGDRIKCAHRCEAGLGRGGVIVWDNSDRVHDQPGYEHLLRQGFRRLDFTGLGPINVYEWCTSIFYRADNCLGL